MPMSSNNTSVEVNHDRIDQLELAIIENLDPVNIDITHLFTKGMYIRQMLAPKGAIITSKIHKTQHPYILSQGSLMIWQENGEWVKVKAPHMGTTEPGTRRVVSVLEDCIWTTFHAHRTITGREIELSLPEQQTIVDRIEKKIIQKHKVKEITQ